MILIHAPRRAQFGLILSFMFSLQTFASDLPDVGRNNNKRVFSALSSADARHMQKMPVPQDTKKRPRRTLSEQSIASSPALDHVPQQEMPLLIADTQALEAHEDVKCYKIFTKPELPQSEADLLDWIARANKGDVSAQQKIVDLNYWQLCPIKLRDKLNFRAWHSDFESWVLEDLRRIPLVVKAKPQFFLQRPTLVLEIEHRAAQNDPEARMGVATLLLRGIIDRGIEIERQKEALNHTMYAASSGHIVAMTELGKLIQRIEGKNTPHNKSKEIALDWLAKAAHLGLPRAMYWFVVLNRQYHRITGESKMNHEKALDLLLQAAGHGDTKAMLRLGEHYKKSSSDYYKAAPENQEAVRWLSEGANLGHPGCMYELGDYWINRRHASKDEESSFQQGLRWCIKAAEQGHEIAIYDLACLYFDEEYGVNDPAHAIYWSIKSRSIDLLEKHFYRAANLVFYKDQNSLGRSNYQSLQMKLQEIAGEYLAIKMQHCSDPQPSDAMLKGRLPKVPGLYRMYEPLNKLVARTLVLLEALENPGTLINILQLKDSKPFQVSAENKSRPFAEHTLVVDDVPYRLISIERANVCYATEIIDLICGFHPLWKAAQQSMGELENLILSSQSDLLKEHGVYERKYKAIRSFQQELRELPSLLPKQEEELKRYKKQKRKLKNNLKICAAAHESFMFDLTRIQALQSLRSELCGVVITHLDERNVHFHKDNPWIDSLQAH